MKTRTISKRARLEVVEDYPDVPRPRTRGECADGPRPCPWVSCKYHLALDVTPAGAVKIDTRPLEEMPETCALDVADRGSHTLEQIGEITGLVRERVRQIEQLALDGVRAGAPQEWEVDT